MAENKDQNILGQEGPDSCETPEIADEEAVQQESFVLSKDEYEQVKQHIEKLQSDCKNLKEEYEKTVLLAQRIQADFDNYRKRNAAIRAESLDEGIRSVVKELLPVLDNFERAMNGSAAMDEAWLNGLQLVRRQLFDVLKKAGLEEVPAEGKFDPELHNAVLQEESEEIESGHILEVLLKGYKVKNCIIRHSMVKVAK